MKTKLLLLALALTTLAPLSARAEAEVSFDFFYDNLSPYGDWITVGDYGTCWRPREVDADWSPYTDGYWSYTDAGWTWISYEDFGDICYHYGRWVRTDDVGWCWVPDTEWGPAWVSWRKTDDHIGWAPLPPEARWRPSVGFSVWVDDTYDIGPSYYNFCPLVDFGAPVIRGVCVSRSRAFGLFGLSVNITNISYNNYGHHVFCGGPDYGYVNRFSRRHVPALKLVQNTTIVNNNVTIINNQRIVQAPHNAVAGNTLQVYSPKIVNSAPVHKQPKITQVLARPQIDKGWTGVKDPAQAKQMREKVKADSKGLTAETAPARPVQVADLKPLPEKADTTAPSPVQARPQPTKGKGKQIATRPPVEQPNQVPGAVGKPASPLVGAPEDKPAKVAVDQPEKPAKATGKPGKTGKVTRPAVSPEISNQPAKPGVMKPFREQPTITREPNTPTPPETVPVAPTKKSKKGEAPSKITREQVQPQTQIPRTQPQPDPEIAQRHQADLAERQRKAAADAAARRQMDAQRSQQAQEALAERRQQQLEAQRQKQMQQQVPVQRSQPQVERPQRPQPQVQRPQPQVQKQAPAQAKQRPQPQPQAQPAAKGKQLTPEEIEALKKKR